MSEHFSEENCVICNNQTIDENKYPCLQELRQFLQKIPSIKACYLSGDIVQTHKDIVSEPIIHIYIISDELSLYVKSAIKKKSERVFQEQYFPNYVLVQPYFLKATDLNNTDKFCLKCDSVFWFGTQAIHEEFPDYCMKDIQLNNKNYTEGADILRKNLQNWWEGTTLWINIAILLNVIISAIYEKNSSHMKKHENGCSAKYCAIIHCNTISEVDKEIVQESFKVLKHINTYPGSKHPINKQFFNFIINYLDYCNNKIKFSHLLQGEYGSYRRWITIIEQPKDTNLEPEDRKDFDYLFNLNNNKDFNRIHRDQHLLNKLVPKQRKGVNPAGLTPDQVNRIQKK